MQVSRGLDQRNGLNSSRLVASVQQTYHTGGLRSFYAGFSATCLLDVAYATAQFFAMEQVDATSPL